jgi:hypothetical protein
MSASCTTLRLITILFLLAGILLLRKPLFGQTTLASPPTRATPLVDKPAGQYNRVGNRVPDNVLHIESAFEAIGYSASQSRRPGSNCFDLQSA